MTKLSTVSIFRTFKSGSLALAVLLGTSLCVQAGPDYTDSKDSKDKNVIQKPVVEPKWWIDLGAGGEFDAHATKFTKDSDANFALPGAAPLIGKLQSRDFETTHQPVVDGKAELGYKVLPYMSLFVGFTFSHAYGEGDTRVGSVTDPTGAYGPVGGRYNVYGNFHQYKAYTGRAGVKVNMPRYVLDLIHAPKCISPYFSISAGGKNIDDQRAQFYAKDGRLFSTNYLLLYDNSLVFTGEAELGYDVKLTRNFDITFESGYGYDTKPDHDEISGIHHTNHDGDRFYSTVTLGAKYKF